MLVFSSQLNYTSKQTTTQYLFGKEWLLFYFFGLLNATAPFSFYEETVEITAIDYVTRGDRKIEKMTVILYA